MSNENPGGNAPRTQAGAIAPFTVEFADDHCRNFTIATPPIQGQDIRGRWDISRLANRKPERGRTDFGSAASRIPSPIPGAMLSVDVRKKTARLFDPLKETQAGKEILEEYNRVTKDIPVLHKQHGWSAFDAIDYTLDDDQLKTLLCELRRMLTSKCLDVVEGTIPDEKQIESLAGHELYDPANQSHDKPRYKKDYQEWINRQRLAGVV